MKTTTTRYQIVIQSAPRAPFQTYAGWDAVYASKKEALAAAKRAERAGHHAVQVVTVKGGA